MHAFVDLKSVASQVKGSYEAKGEKTTKYKEKSLEIIQRFNNFLIRHIPKEQNRNADALSKLAAVQCEGLTKGVLIEELDEKSMDTAKVNAIIEEATRTWMTPIQEYIEKKILPEDTTKQAKYLIKEVHMGSYEMHDGPRRAVHKAINAGYFWPSMHWDANNEISSCDSCHDLRYFSMALSKMGNGHRWPSSQGSGQDQEPEEDSKPFRRSSISNLCPSFLDCSLNIDLDHLLHYTSHQPIITLGISSVSFNVSDESF
nr:hypothetical protein [Tanacetum cinerariifolium]